MKYISLVYLFRFTFHIWQTRPEFWIFVTTLSINCSVSMMILLLNPGVIDVLHQVLLHLLGWEEQGHPWLWVPWVLSLLWHKRAGVSNTSDLILDFEWTSLEARERERERATLYLTLLSSHCQGVLFFVWLVAPPASLSPQPGDGWHSSPPAPPPPRLDTVSPVWQGPGNLPAPHSASWRVWCRAGQCQ